MAVFKKNICKFNNCELIFSNLESLVKHIESNHINYDRKIIEQFENQPPTCVPLFFFSSTENSILEQTLSSTNSNSHEKNSKGQSDAQTDAQSLANEEKSAKWVTVKTNARIVKNKVKKTFKCNCGKTYGTNPSLRKHAAQCRKTAAITSQINEIFQQKAESSTNVNNDDYSSGVHKDSTQQFSSPIALKQISVAPGTSLKTLVLSKKSTTKTIQGVSHAVQPPQRVMIQLAELKSVTA